MALTPTAVCPDDCVTTLLYKAIPADTNCVTRFSSEIQNIIIQPEGAPIPFTGWAAFDNSANLVTLTAGAIDNTNTDNTKCKVLKVIGEESDPDTTEIPGPGFTDIILRERFNPTFQIYNMDWPMYEFLRQLKCNKINYTFWMLTEDFVFGVENGIVPVRTNVKAPKPSGRDSILIGTLEISYEAKNLLDRVNNPYS